jgi:probable blue pigment (indigoidine) exporter
VPITRDYAVGTVGLPLLAALLWASYYIFVLAVTPGTAPSAVFTYPFVFGGLAYAIACGLRGQGRTFLALWATPGAWLRVALLIGMQLSVLASTYLAGPVDTSLLSLIGDVVLTPILVAVFFLEYRRGLRSHALWAGMVLCLLGGALAIVGSGRLGAIPHIGYVVVVTIPLTVAGYFLACARENQRTGPEAVVGQSMLGAAVVGLLLSPLLPGGWPGLAVGTAGPLAILVATGVTSFYVAPALYFASIRRAGFVIPAILMTGIPVFAAILGWGVLGIAIPPVGILGIPLAVLGSVLALRGERASPSPAPAPIGP